MTTLPCSCCGDMHFDKTEVPVILPGMKPGKVVVCLDAKGCQRRAALKNGSHIQM